MADVKEKRLKGLSNFGIFPTVVDTSTAYSATGPRIALEGANTLNATDTVNTTDIPADDNPKWDSETVWDGTDIQYAVRAMLLEHLALLKGATVNTDGSVDESLEDVAPKVAINFSALRKDGGYRCFLYYACELTSAQVNFQTKSNSANPQDYTLAFSCAGRSAPDDEGRHPVRRVAEFDTLTEALEWLNTPPEAVAGTP